MSDITPDMYGDAFAIENFIASPNVLLSVENLNVSFGESANKNTVIDDISFKVHAGELVALVGESGSGKSLTALSILGLTPQEATRNSGQIYFNGEDVCQATQARLQNLRGNRIAMVFQEPMSALNPLHTIGRQIIESFIWHQNPTSADAKKRLDELLDLVGLTHFKDRLHAFPHHLSGGERQRVMIAMAMANTPDLLICDEPTTALDVTLQHQILRLLKDLQQRYKMGILLITHDLPVVRKVAERVCVMKQGKIVEDRATADLFRAPEHAYTKQLIHALPPAQNPPISKDAATIITCENLRVYFPIKSTLLRRTIDVVRAVDDVSLSIKKGETLGLVGESGSGKSSLAFALLRLAKSTGSIVFMGDSIETRSRKELRHLRDKMQIVFQDPFSSLNPRMNVGYIIAEGLKTHRKNLSRKDIAAQVATILQEVGLEPAMAERYPHEFSGGQRQRIAIARAMILRPSFVVLDEPTSALDMSVQSTILSLLQRFQREIGVSYLLISHDLRVIRALSHQIIVLKGGKIVEAAETEALYNSPQHDYTKSLLHAAYGESL